MKLASDLTILYHLRDKDEGWNKKVVVGTVIQLHHEATRIAINARITSNTLTWGQYDGMHTQGISQCQTAQMLEVPRSMLQAWQLSQNRLDARSAVVAFVDSILSLAFLHHLVSEVQIGP